MGSVADVRGVIRTALAAVDGWVESPVVPDQFGRDTSHKMPQCFAVQVGQTEVSDREPRQRVSEGLNVQSRFQIHWARRIMADKQSDSYDLALDAEQELVQALRAIVDPSILIEGMDRRGSASEGYILGTIRCRAWHRYSLS